jgi:hypothetical protein
MSAVRILGIDHHRDISCQRGEIADLCNIPTSAESTPAYSLYVGTTPRVVARNIAEIAQL